MRRKKGQEQRSSGSSDGRITPQDVQQVEFRLAFRGYKERDVDAFLDRVTEDLAVYLEELERLRRSAGAAGSTAEAAEMVARGREEAVTIVRRAEQEAETIRAAAHVTTGDPRAAVAPFLSRERAFLQDLGNLVQTHANGIREMVQTVRGSPAADERSGWEERGAVPPEPTPLGEADAEETPTPAATQEPLEEPVIVERTEEAAFNSENAPAEARESSLRELFWGED